MDFERKSVRKSRLYPVIVLEKIFPHRFRHRTYDFLFNTTLFFGALSIAFYALSKNNEFLGEAGVAVLGERLPTIAGLTLIVFSLWAVVFLLEGFFRSYYFKEIDKNTGDFTFDVLMVLYGARKSDLTKAFLSSFTGKEIMFRSGVSRDAVKDFLKNRNFARIENLEIHTDGKMFNISNFVELLLNKDEQFSRFLFNNGIKKKDCIGAAREEKKKKYKEKWWSKERLSRVKPLGESWSYGYTYLLNKYSRDVLFRRSSFISELRNTNELLQLNTILERDRGANAIIVGEDGVGKMKLVRDFARRISKETSSEKLRHKRVVVLDTKILVASTGDKTRRLWVLI